MSLYEQLEATTKAYVRGYDLAVETKNIKEVSAVLTPDCIRYFAPARLLQLLPILASGRTNEGYEEQEGPIFAQWKSAENKILDMTIDDRQLKVAFNLLHHCESADGKSYDFEHAVTLFMTEDGKKVRKINQYVDTLSSKEFLDAENQTARIESVK